MIRKARNGGTQSRSWMITPSNEVTMAHVFGISLPNTTLRTVIMKAAAARTCPTCGGYEFHFKVGASIGG